MKTTKPTVTVAISAYNEEKNIRAFLESVISQKEKGFVLENIWAYSDGSTDKTMEIARSIKSPKIGVFEGKKRVGKSSRLNQIYSRLKSDILVQSDADVVFSHPHVIRDVIKPIIENKKVGMCGGNPKPVLAETFTEKAVNCTFEAYQSFRESVRGGDNKFSADGRLLAIRRELVKKINVPSDMIANDVYIYFCCLTLGYKYRYVENAVVSFRLPQTLKDQIRQNTRFMASSIRMRKYFTEEIVAREYHIPPNMLLKNVLIQFIKHPVLCSYIFAINRYCWIKARAKEKYLNAKWDMAWSSKFLFKSGPNSSEK